MVHLLQRGDPAALVSPEFGRHSLSEVAQGGGHLRSSWVPAAGLSATLAIAVLGLGWMVLRSQDVSPSSRAIPVPEPTKDGPRAAGEAEATEKAEPQVLLRVPASRSDIRLRPVRRNPQAASLLARETELLRRALHRLHQERDGKGALLTLDEYRRQFSSGRLSGEADVIRLESLLLLEDRLSALALLDKWEKSSFVGLPRMQELRVLHAELLAEEKRCEESIRALDGLLGGVQGKLRERALYRRAVCYSRQGQVEQAAADFHMYLKEFPMGQFAEAAKFALKSRGG